MDLRLNTKEIISIVKRASEYYSSLPEASKYAKPFFEKADDTLLKLEFNIIAAEDGTSKKESNLANDIFYIIYELSRAISGRGFSENVKDLPRMMDKAVELSESWAALKRSIFSPKASEKSVKRASNLGAEITWIVDHDAILELFATLPEAVERELASRIEKLRAIEKERRDALKLDEEHEKRMTALLNGVITVDEYMQKSGGKPLYDPAWDAYAFAEERATKMRDAAEALIELEKRYVNEAEVLARCGLRDKLERLSSSLAAGDESGATLAAQSLTDLWHIFRKTMELSAEQWEKTFETSRKKQ